ncbi:MAG TPA: serine protease [Candidatus Paceibacterota bacterium]|nr:serine protease [Candidatus Paceibacterota bacterium]
MDMEELTNSQVVLLVLLVSFVTSVATGIVTVSLMNEAPPQVAQTVNRVLEQTIQEVSAPAQNASAAAPSPKTVAVNPEVHDVAYAVKKATPSVIRLYSSDSTTFLGLGVVLDASGTVVTDTAALSDQNHVLIEQQNGEQIPADVSERDAGNGLAFLSVSSNTTATTSPWVPMGTETSGVELGESVVLIAGQSTLWVGSGLVSSLPTTSQNALPLVKTDISGDNVLYGSPLIDTNGDLVGISTEVSRAVSPSAFMPVSAIEADISGSLPK